MEVTHGFRALDALSRKLLSAGSVAEAAVGELVTKVSQGVKESARGYVPKDTGALHDSIEVRRNNPLSARVVASAYNSSGDDYAGFVEWGTARHPEPVLYMYRANQDWWPVFVAGMGVIGASTLGATVDTAMLGQRSESSWSNRMDRRPE